jgi:hypothetical protein
MDTWREVLTFVALLGTGGVIGSWLNELRQSRRDDRLRWYVNRREAYERLLTAMHEWRMSELQIAESVGTLRQLTGWQDDPIFDEAWFLKQADSQQDDTIAYLTSKVRKLRKDADTFRREVDASLAAVEMISSAPVVQRANGLREDLHSLVGIAADFPPRECGGWSEPLAQAYEQHEESRKQFINDVRKELAVK